VTVLSTVVDVLAAQLALAPQDIDPDRPLSELPGMESVLLLRAVADIEDACGVSIPDDLLFETGTARDLALVVVERGGSA